MQRVLFVCIGNSCRSQMAEGFARAYGGDVMVPASAGIAPALMVAADSRRAMTEKKISVDDHFPKILAQLAKLKFDLIVNMCGVELPESLANIRTSKVLDPVGPTYEMQCCLMAEIET